MRSAPRPIATRRSSSCAPWASTTKTLADLREGRAAAAPRATIRAPIDGTVVEKLISPGPAAAGGHHALLHHRRPVDASGSWPTSSRPTCRTSPRATRRTSRPPTTPAADPRQGRLRRRAGRSQHPGHRGPGRSSPNPERRAQAGHVRARRDPLAPRSGRAAPAGLGGAARRREPALRLRGQPDGTFARRRGHSSASAIGDRLEVTDGPEGRRAGRRSTAALFLQFAESQ